MSGIMTSIEQSRHGEKPSHEPHAWQILYMTVSVIGRQENIFITHDNEHGATPTVCRDEESIKIELKSADSVQRP